jgi:tRNA (guanine-N7-)-methyltransferase
LIDGLLPSVALPEGAIDPHSLFPHAREVALEIGFGGGEHLAAQARAHPERGFIGCEPFVNGVAKLLTQIEAQKLGNIRVHAGDALAIIARLPAHSIATVFVLFPDPWPKLRHHKRRFIRAEVLDELARILRPGGELRLATDHMEYARWALAHLMADRRFVWAAEGPSEWRSRPEDWPPTRYEQKALARGARCVYLRFVRA